MTEFIKGDLVRVRLDLLDTSSTPETIRTGIVLKKHWRFPTWYHIYVQGLGRRTLNGHRFTKVNND